MLIVQAVRQRRSSSPNQRQQDHLLLPIVVTFPHSGNEKAPEYDFKGFIFGGSGEIRTRDQLSFKCGQISIFINEYLC